METNQPPSAPGDRRDDGGGDWVTVWTVWHVGAKKYIVRKDGEPFRFRRRRKRGQ